MANRYEIKKQLGYEMMMNELTESIYELTVSMKSALLDGKDEEFETLLNERNELMLKVNTLKAAEPEFRYSPQAKRFLAAALELDGEMVPVINENMTKTQNQINQMKVNKQVSKKYQPYFKQTNGAFIDAKN
ncbi:hypothetical protein RCG19_19720 [Neobacillus sp. OS1-2]|uniref:hypothetical protein n=1 Tax=Neobacillus sp. OS1-2 TaxID=3070680 RepID=UPI0027E04A62|nr:hypothetical protein [Neobacillus sp. OS1-2]WML39383.1 hypothetical protein RCG19_19720 [Neobacillus sp. OS1-2]